MVVRLLLALLSACVVQGKVSQGALNVSSQWHFLDMFCYDKQGGKLVIEYEESETTPAGQQILIYHDLDHGFPSVYDSGNSCKFKRAAARDASTKTSIARPGGAVFTVTGRRPRFWYIVVANCDNKEERLELKNYKITFHNDGGKYSREFSYDEEGIYQALIFCTIALVFAFFLFFFSFCRTARDTTVTVHQLFAVMIFVIIAEFLSVVLQLTHHSIYSGDGYGVPLLDASARFFDIVPETLFVSLLIFVSKGWQISAFRLPDGALRTVAEVLIVYGACSFALFMWSYRTADPVLVLSTYQSPPGVMLTVLRVLLALWFMSNMAFTWRNERAVAKKAFYVKFLFFGLFFLLTLPAVVVVAQILDPWNRKKAVLITNLLLTVLCYFIFWMLFACGAQHIRKNLDDDADRERLAGSDEMGIDDRQIDMGSDVGAVEFAAIDTRGKSEDGNDDDNDDDNDESGSGSDSDSDDV